MDRQIVCGLEVSKEVAAEAYRTWPTFARPTTAEYVLGACRNHVLLVARAAKEEPKVVALAAK